MWLYIFQNAMWFFRSEKLACSHGFLTTELILVYILTKSILLLDDLWPKKCKTTISANDYFQIKRNIAELAGWPKNSFIKVFRSAFFFRKLLLFYWWCDIFFHKLLRIARKNSAGQRGSLNSKKCPPRQRVLFIPKGVSSSLVQRGREVIVGYKCYKISQ